MRTSVLISTYNGEQFIEEQLTSLLRQTVQPDEVLIVDDCSTDSTYAIVRSFVQQYGLDGWTLSQNECNKGFRANFRALAEAASGDLVFFCDQDDVWGNRKIESCVNFMTDFPDVNLVCTEFISGSTRPAADALNTLERGGGWDFDRVLPHKGKPYVWLGCAMAVRRSFIHEILPYWDAKWAHDECVWCMAEATGGGAILCENHLWHRVHGGNATGMKVHEVSRRTALIEEKAEGYAATVRFCRDRGIGGDALKLFAGKAGCERARAEFLKNPSLVKAALLLRHLAYYLEVRSYPVDLAIAFGLMER